VILAKKGGMVKIPRRVTSRERSGIKPILHELNPLLTINVTIREIKVKMSTVESIARPRRNGERRRAPTASISKESPAITGVVEMEIGRAVQQECRDRSRMPSSA